MIRRIVGDVGQWLGALGTIGGSFLEVKDKAPWVTVIVMVAAFAWGIATKVKYYRTKAEIRNAMMGGKNI